MCQCDYDRFVKAHDSAQGDMSKARVIAKFGEFAFRKFDARIENQKLHVTLGFFRDNREFEYIYDF